MYAKNNPAGWPMFDDGTRRAFLTVSLEALHERRSALLGYLYHTKPDESAEAKEEIAMLDKALAAFAAINNALARYYLHGQDVMPTTAAIIDLWQPGADEWQAVEVSDSDAP